MAATTTKNVLVLLLLALLPLAALSSRASPPPAAAHRSHGHGHTPSSPPGKHPPPPTPSSSPPDAPPAAPAAAALVRATCNSTAYYDLCVSTLGADPSSATADVRGLSAIAVSAAAANASSGAATAAALAAANNGSAPAAGTRRPAASAADGTVQALLHACAGKYGSARDALSAARDAIAVEDYDSASVHVGAAAEYPQVCRALFRRQRPGQYPPELAAREETLKQLCSVALDIVALLSNSS